MDNKQAETWRSDFGVRHTERNPHTADEIATQYKNKYGVSRNDLCERFLEPVDRDADVLEVGTNVGSKLDCLAELGFENLFGIEVQSYAASKARELHPEFTIVQATAGAIPFEDDSFDLVFTSDLLIHIEPQRLQQVLGEIYRCTRQYIWGIEYYAPEHTMIDYRANDDLLWKGDFVTQYSQGRSLSVLQLKKLPYLDSDNADEMFLLTDR